MRGIVIGPCSGHWSDTQTNEHGHYHGNQHLSSTHDILQSKEPDQGTSLVGCGRGHHTPNQPIGVVRWKLLFERFPSTALNGPPDIDVDIEPTAEGGHPVRVYPHTGAAISRWLRIRHGDAAPSSTECGSAPTAGWLVRRGGQRWVPSEAPSRAALRGVDHLDQVRHVVALGSKGSGSSTSVRRSREFTPGRTCSTVAGGGVGLMPVMIGRTASR
jgi:hypothetical protein